MKGPPGREVLTVSEVSGRISRCLEAKFRDVWIRGEIGEFTRPASGHWYFTLKDSGAQLRAVMFKFKNVLLRFVPESGMEVLCRGKITAYAQRGVYQIQVEWMEVQGRGALYLEFEKLKERLAKEGLFDPARKRPVPSPLKRIAIITSMSGAAIQDMLRILRERDPGIEVLIIPAQVQGRGAAEGLARALDQANLPAISAPPGGRPLEAIVIGRGGGSIEDLWAFNEEVLARAIARSRAPVISAVGHEIDFTIADFVADLRAPTPTAAAEMAAGGRAERRGRLAHAGQRMRMAMGRRIENADAALSAARLIDPRREILDYMIRIDELSGRNERALHSRLQLIAQRLDAGGRALVARDPRHVHGLQMARLENLGARLFSIGGSVLDLQGHRLEKAGVRLHDLSPRATLARGFAIARDAKGRVIRDAREVIVGADLDVVVHRGRLGVRVNEVKDDD